MGRRPFHSSPRCFVPLLIRYCIVYSCGICHIDIPAPVQRHAHARLTDSQTVETSRQRCSALHDCNWILETSKSPCPRPRWIVHFRARSESRIFAASFISFFLSSFARARAAERSGSTYVCTWSGPIYSSEMWRSRHIIRVPEKGQRELSRPILPANYHRNWVATAGARLPFDTPRALIRSEVTLVNLL